MGNVKKRKFEVEKKISDDSLNILEQAWDNLPSDMAVDERAMFIELTEKVLKEHNKLKNSLEDKLSN